MTSRLAMIGVDAADLRWLQANARELPNFQRLLDGAAPLATTSEGLVGSVWPTFYTGTTPGEHGIHHRQQWDARTMRLRRVTPDWLPVEPFWQRLAQAGVRVSVVDVPMTFASSQFAGLQVLNWGTHDRLAGLHVSDHAIATQVQREFGSHPMGIEVPVHKSPVQLRRIRDDLVAGAARKGALLRWLLQRQPWDFFLAAFGECHRAGHLLWPGDDGVPAGALLDVYRAVDDALGGVLEAIGDVPAIVFSPNGMQQNLTQGHFVPAILDRIETLHSGNGSRATGLIRALRDVVPAQLQNAAARTVPAVVRDWIDQRTTTGGRDWRHTRAFPLISGLHGHVQLNVAGREARGCLQPHDVPAFTESLLECFAEITVADSAVPLVRDIVSAPRRYPGPRSAHLPDWTILCESPEAVRHVQSPRLGKVTRRGTSGRGGHHRHEGFVAARGLAGAAFADITDFAPWVLDRFLGARA